MVIRDALPEDLPAAAKLAAGLVRMHHAFDAERFMKIEPLEEGYEFFLRSQLGRKNVVFLVAVVRRDGVETVAGYLFGGLEGRDWMQLLDACGWIHDLYVEESARGDGIGESLLEEAVARLEAMGAPRVVLTTAWANTGAQRFFERHGFRKTMVEMTRERSGVRSGERNPP